MWIKISMLDDILIYGFSFGLVGVIVFLFLRFGPVSKSWLNISKQEGKKLKKLHKRYKTKKGIKKQKPKGKALYKKKMVSHDGVAIYPEGLYAKFCIGKKGKYKFIPYNRISGIYPVKIKNQFSKSDSRMFGLSSWKSLQIETKDYQTLLIDSRKHDFEQIIPILKRSMGVKWNQVYNGEEVIQGTIGEGNVGVHEYLRKNKEEKDYFDEDSKTDISGTVWDKKSRDKENIKIDKSRGALLSKETPSQLENREKRYSIVGILLMVGGILSLALMLSSLSNISLFGLGIILKIFLLMLGIMFIPIGYFVYRASNRHKPIKIYENGILDYVLGTGDELFIPYGYFTDVEEGNNPIDGEYYRLVAKKDKYSVAISRDIPNIDRLVNEIKKKFDSPDLDYEPENDLEKNIWKKIEPALYFVALAIGFGFASYLSFKAFGGGSLNSLMFGIGILGPIFSSIFIFLIGYKLISKFKEIDVSEGINIKLVAIFLITILVIFSFTYGYSSMSMNESSIQIDKTPMPSESIELSFFDNKSEVTTDQNIVLSDGDSLRLSNMDIHMNGSRDKIPIIWVGENSSLFIENCTLKSIDNDHGFEFEVYGEMEITDSEICGLWGDPDMNNGDGGIEIYSDDVLIDNCRIYDNVINGLLIYDASPIITNNEIYGCGDDGIEVHSSDMVFESNEIRDNDWGMVIFSNSNLVIENNTFLENQHGISIEDSKPIIINNQFTRNTEYAIEVGSNSDPQFEGNEFSENEQDISENEDYIGLLAELCGFIQYGLTLTFFGVLCFLQKREYGKIFPSKEKDDGF